MNTPTRILATALIVLLAVGAVAWKYGDYLANPWTRNGQLSANVVRVTPRVSGPIVELPVVDNQAVEVGDLLFRIDPRTFKEALAKATAEEVRTKADFERATELIKTGGISRRDYDKTVAAQDVARAEMETARLNLEFTEMRASVSGYVTNLNLRIGSQAIANQPVMALVDTSSFFVHGFFRESVVDRIQPGMPAVVTLMTYSQRPLTGVVESIGWGIYQDDGASGPDLLPKIRPTFEWIRLAQRIPVRVRLGEVPDDVALRVGTTASVLVMTEGGSPEGTPPLPAPLQ